MIRLQLAFFVAYGLLSGLAFSAALESRERQARADAVIAVYLSLPPKALSEVRI